jgi:hypothetical protein
MRITRHVITGSVGRWEKNARNLAADVEIVQRLCKRRRKGLKLPNSIHKALMERLRSRRGSRTQWQ